MKRVSLLCVVLPLAASAHAEIPVYRDQQLTIPSGVVMTANGPVYYGDVRFTANQDGSFTLVDAKRRNLADVDAATVTVDATAAAAEVSANGILSIACVALEEPAVVRDGNTFYVVLAETTMAPDAVCMSLVAYTPFNANVALDLAGLEAGEYRVRVNGVERVFELESSL
jgi:hypothetical protein